VVGGSSPSPSGEGVARSATGGASNVTAFSGTAATATALKAEPEAKLSPTQALEALQWQQPQRDAKAMAADRRAEAKAKGYEGEMCGECGNFTLVRNGTCMKCDTCGSTTGCS
jgi:ribonucleoside-diphosphate reductase alpha chain